MVAITHLWQRNSWLFPNQHWSKLVPKCDKILDGFIDISSYHKSFVSRNCNNIHCIINWFEKKLSFWKKSEAVCQPSKTVLFNFHIWNCCWSGNEAVTEQQLAQRVVHFSSFWNCIYADWSYTKRHHNLGEDIFFNRKMKNEH